MKSQGLLLLVIFVSLLLPTASGTPRPQGEGAGARGKGEVAQPRPLAWAYGEPASATQREVEAPLPPDDGKLLHVPGSSLAFTMFQINSRFAPADWFPGDHPTMPEVVANGRKPDGPSRVRRDERACSFCHYPNGKGHPENAGPAGLSAAYILQQLADFASGARKSMEPGQETVDMIQIASRLKPDEAKEAADYFSALKWTPWIKVVETRTVPTHGSGSGNETVALGQTTLLEVPVDNELRRLRDPRSGFIAYVPPGTLKDGEALVERGGPGKTVGCAACHGLDLKGNGYFPSLAGRDPSYIARQLYDFQHFSRVGPGAQLMQSVVKNLSESDITAIAAYVASLAP